MTEDNSIIKSIAFIAIFFTLTPIALITSAFTLFTLNNPHPQPTVLAAQDKNIIYAALPEEFPTIHSSVEGGDARVEIIRQYLERWNSPMINQADHLVQMADKYNLDFRLTTAIAQQESNLCKVIPPETYNCWGWGIHNKGTLGFNSYEEGIETVSKGLRESYLDKGYLTAEEIMSKYTPLSPGSWAKGVNKFMLDMK